MTEHVLITGVSSGIGRSLAELCLERGRFVYGIGRSYPDGLRGHPRFQFCSVDFASPRRTALRVDQWLRARSGLADLRTVFWNAGTVGEQLAPMHVLPPAAVERVMNVNVWSGKVVLDQLLQRGLPIRSCVISASSAGVRARSGFGPYAISKAALHMLASVYAQEHPQIRFLVLGLCSVDTPLFRKVLELPLEGELTALADLRKRAIVPGYLVPALERARQLLDVVEGPLGDELQSGSFVEMRALLQREAPGSPEEAGARMLEDRVPGNPEARSTQTNEETCP